MGYLKDAGVGGGGGGGGFPLGKNFINNFHRIRRELDKRDSHIISKCNLKCPDNGEGFGMVGSVQLAAPALFSLVPDTFL